MDSMFPAKAKLRLVPALLVGIVWQMGTCSCGCIEHNLWLEMYQRLAAHSDLTGPEASTATVDAHDCDHGSRDSFMRGRTIAEDNPSSVCQPLAFLTLPASTFSPMLLDCLSRSANTGRCSDAHEVRAFLQVFQL